MVDVVVVVVVGVGGVTEQTELSGGVTTWRIVFVTGPVWVSKICPLDCVVS